MQGLRPQHHAPSPPSPLTPFSPSQYNVALDYSYAKGCEQSFGKAVKWFANASDQGLESGTSGLESVKKTLKTCAPLFSQRVVVRGIVLPDLSAETLSSARGLVSLGVACQGWYITDRHFPTHQAIDFSYREKTPDGVHWQPPGQYTIQLDNGKEVKVDFPRPGPEIPSLFLLAEQAYLRIKGQVSRGEVTWAKLLDEERERMGEVVAIWNECAAASHVQAQVELGSLYGNGHGVAQDDARAVKLFTQAAIKGDSVAQFNLGARYVRAAGCEQSLGNALKWYAKSAAQGYPGAKARLAQVRGDKKAVCPLLGRRVSLCGLSTESLNGARGKAVDL